MTTLRLPPNPYQRSPIKNTEHLAGRDGELKTIRYYLGLTTAGQSPHIALIGQRGVGKTSLLNATRAVALELNILPVSLDMNEQKVMSPGRFWQDLYQSLALVMVEAGCWGGVHGPLYAALLQMIHSGQPGTLDNAVMQIPYVLSCHKGGIDTFVCPDALVMSDFRACLGELKRRGISGLAFLIDEADCLGKNVPLLQMFRNIFQVVTHCSLFLAGTDAVFPALSDVFSPIPRQFHRVDVKPFASWSDTMELVARPLSKDVFTKIQPTSDLIQELHELCGGAPDEVQLYCHHMYRSVEEGSSSSMTLAPRVFREVLKEYSSHSYSNAEAVVGAITRLPDKWLFESKWLSRRNLSLAENIYIETLSQELTSKEVLDEHVRSDLSTELHSGYQKLFELGVTETAERIRVIGAPLTTGFWKSFVKVERKQSWTWDDYSFAESIRLRLIRSIAEACSAPEHIETISGKEALSALALLREGRIPAAFDEGMIEMILAAVLGKTSNASHAVDVTFTIESPAGKQSFQSRFFEAPGQVLESESIQRWINSVQAVLSKNTIAISFSDAIRWKLPSQLELHRLGRISGYRIPEMFGPPQTHHAIEKFARGDIQGCMEIFISMLNDKESYSIRNNLAFCQIVSGRIAEGLENVRKALATEYSPLHELNKGVAEFLLGEIASAKQSVQNALEKLRSRKMDIDKEASYVLLVDSVGGGVKSVEGLPVDAALIMNLGRMGVYDRNKVVLELSALYPGKSDGWVQTYFPAL